MDFAALYGFPQCFFGNKFWVSGNFWEFLGIYQAQGTATKVNSAQHKTPWMGVRLANASIFMVNQMAWKSPLGAVSKHL
jgi:hypothetical protein